MHHIAFPHILLVAFLDRARFEEKFERKTYDECWPWLYHTSDGYGKFRLKGKMYFSNRVAWFFEYKKDPGDLLVMHKCNNRPCCNPAHLILGTESDNMKHKFITGAQDNKGVNHPRALLNEEIVYEIRDSKLSTRQEAKERGISQTAVSFIRTGKTWKHIPFKKKEGTQ